MVAVYGKKGLPMKLQIRCLVFVDGRKDEGNTTRKEGTLHVRHCPFPAWVDHQRALLADLGLGSPNPTTLLPSANQRAKRRKGLQLEARISTGGRGQSSSLLALLNIP